MRRFAQRSIDGEEARILELYRIALRSPKPTSPRTSPSRSTVLRNRRRPRLFSFGETEPLILRGPTWRRHGLECQQGEPRSSEVGPMYLQRYGACGLSLSCLRHSRKSPPFCRLHALAIDDRCTGALLASLTPSDTGSKGVMDFLPSPIDSPLLEVHIDRRVRRKIAREQAPSTAATQKVEDGIDHRPEICRTRPASRLGCWK